MDAISCSRRVSICGLCRSTASGDADPLICDPRHQKSRTRLAEWSLARLHVQRHGRITGLRDVVPGPQANTHPCFAVCGGSDPQWRQGRAGTVLRLDRSDVHGCARADPVRPFVSQRAQPLFRTSFSNRSPCIVGSFLLPCPRRDTLSRGRGRRHGRASTHRRRSTGSIHLNDGRPPMPRGTR